MVFLRERVRTPLIHMKNIRKNIASFLIIGIFLLNPLNGMKSGIPKTSCDKTIADADNAFSMLQKSTQDLRRTLEQLQQLSSFIPLLAPAETDKHCLEINCLESGPCIQFKQKEATLFTFEPGWLDAFVTKNISNIWALEKQGPDFILTHTDRLRIRISANKTLTIESAKDAWNLKSNGPVFFRGDIEGSDFNFDCPNLTNTGTLAVKRLKTSGEFINQGSCTLVQLNAKELTNEETLTLDSESESPCIFSLENSCHNLGAIVFKKPSEFVCKSLFNEGDVKFETSAKISLSEYFENSGTFASNSKDLVKLHLIKFQNDGQIDCENLYLTGNQLVNKGTLNGQVLDVQMNEILNQATLQSEKRLSLAGSITNDVTASLFGGKKLSLAPKQTPFVNLGRLSSNEEIEITTPTFHNKGVIYIPSTQQTCFSLKGTCEFLNLNKVEIGECRWDNPNLTLQNVGSLSAFSMNGSAAAITNSRLLKIAECTLRVPKIENCEKAKLQIDKTGTFEGKTVSNAGEFVAENGQLNITADLFQNTAESVTGAKQFKLMLATPLQNKGKIFGLDESYLQAPTIENRGQIASGNTEQPPKNVCFSCLTKTFKNFGYLIAGNALLIEAKDQLEQICRATTYGHLILKADCFLLNSEEINGPGSLTLEGTLVANQKPLKVGGTLTIDSHSKFVNQQPIEGGDVSFRSFGEIENESSIKANQSLNCRGKSLKNSGLVFSNKDLILQMVKGILNTRDIHTEGDCVVEVSEGNFVNTGGRLFANGFLTFRVFDLENNYGMINSGGDLTVDAKALVNRRGGVVFHKSDLQPPSVIGYERCYYQGDYETETTGPALLLSGRNLSVNCDFLRNEASGIFASDLLRIKAQRIENEAHLLRNDQKWVKKIRIHPRKFGIVCGSYDKPDSGIDAQPFYVPGCLMAGDSLECIIGGKLYAPSGTYQQKLWGNVPHFLNTGIIQTKNASLKALTADHQAEFVNGVWQANQLTPVFKKPEPILQIIPFINQEGELCVFSYKPKEESAFYMISPTGIKYDASLDERPSRLVVQENRRLQGSERIDMHPVVLAETMARMCQQSFGVPLLDLRDKTILGQVQHLLKNGYDYALDVLQRQGDANGILILTEQEIDEAPSSMIFYKAGSYKGEDGFMSFFVLSKEDEKTLLAEKTEGVIVTDDLDIDISIVKNSGSIVSQGNLTVKSYTIENKRPTFSRKELFKDKVAGLFGSDHVQVYEIKTPQIGGNIVGARIKLIAQDKIVNYGGKIFGLAEVELLAKEGSVELRHLVGTRLVTWDVGKWGALLGARCASLAPVYHPGQVKSEGLLKVEAGEVLILASEIIGQEVLAINSGEGGTRIWDDFGKYLAKDTVTSHGLSFSRSSAEEEVHQPAVLISKNAVTLSSRGKNAIRGSVLQSKLVSLFSEKGNELLASKQALEFKQSAFGISGAGIYSQHCNVAQEVFHNTQIFADIVKIESALDNVLEGTFILGEHAVHIKAGRNNIFRGVPLKTEISGGGWGLSLEFFGSSLLKNEGFADITNDPLGQAIRSLLESKSVPGAIYNVAFSAMEICNALQRFQESKNFMSFLGDRFGVTDLQGKFSPRISLSFSCYDFQRMIKRYISGELAGDEVSIESSGDTVLLDGQAVRGEKHIAIKVGGSLKTTGAESEQAESMEAASASVGNKGSKSMSAMQSDAYDTEHKPAKISSQEVDIHVAQDATFENTQVTGDRIKVSVGGKLTQAVKQDVHTSESFSMAIGVDTKGGAPISLTASTASHHQTHSMDAGMYAEEDLSVEANEVHLVGTDLVSHGSLNLRTNRFEYVDVIDTDESGKIECRLSLPAKGAVVSIPIALKNTQSDCETVRKATVDGATVESTAELGEVNRSVATRREVLDTDDDEFCLFVPVIDAKAYAKLVDSFCRKAEQIAKDSPELFHEVSEEATDGSQSSSASGDIPAEEAPSESHPKMDAAAAINTVISSTVDTVVIEEQTYERHYMERKDSLGRMVQIEILQRPISGELPTPNVTLGDGFGGFIDPDRIASMRICVSHAGDPTRRLEFTTDAINSAVWGALEDFKCQCEALFRSAQEAAQFVYQYAAEHREQLSIAIDFVPGVADVRAGVELLTGHDYITGEDVSRWAAATGLLLGNLKQVKSCVGFAKTSKKGLTQGKKGKQLRASTGSSERLASGEAVRKIERGRFITIVTKADGTVRKGMNVDTVGKHLKKLTKGENPVLRRVKGSRIQSTEMYEVLGDVDCLKKGQFIRLDKSNTIDPSFNEHAHIEVRADKKAKEPLFECLIDECGKFVIRGDE